MTPKRNPFFRWLFIMALWMLVINPARAEDVLVYQLYKGQMFTQTGTNSPVLAPNDPYVFQASATAFAGYVTNPVVETPGGVSEPLASSYQTNLVFNASAASQGALDAAYAAGNYTLSYIGKDDGAASVVLPLGTDAFPPGAPFVSNLVAAQVVNASSNFTLSFAPWPAANSNDFVQLSIWDSNSNVVFATPQLYALFPAPALSATNSEIVITNGTLTNGQNYTAALTFTEATSNSVENLATFTGLPFIVAGFFSQTIFAINTGVPLQTNNLAPPPASPTNLADTELTLIITNGSGAFAPAGAYDLFTTPTGSNYSILGRAGGGFGSGGYAYTQTGTNTGLAIFTDSQAGMVSLQLNFNAAGAGKFLLTSASGMQAGFFTETPAFTAVRPPNVFLPGSANGEFQAWLSGDPGINYIVESSPDLTVWSTLTNLTVPNLSTSFTDSQPPGPRFYRARINSFAFAPLVIASQTFNCSITAGQTPFSTNGIFQFAVGASGNSYQIIDGQGATNGSGTCTYTVTGPSTALISYTDSASGATRNEQLVFTSVAKGFFYTTNTGSAGFQSGTFTLAAGPVLFIGNAKFTPDYARSTSSNFLADGTPLSLSVTDAAGYVWSLNLPADALINTTTITMTPFAGIDSSQSALPILTGVQLGPEGLRFCDGVTLTLTTPAPLGPRATLMMSAGDGSNLLLVQTTNQTNNYSTTLLHFSLGSASDPPPGQTPSQINQAQAAYNEAVAMLKNVGNDQSVPPEPPDDAFTCTGSSPADAQVDEYVFNLFSEETAVIGNLLSAARELDILTSTDANVSEALVLAEQLIEKDSFRKVNLLYSTWKGKPLKWSAVFKATTTAAHADLLYHGPGLPGLLGDLESWLKGDVVNYYWDKLRVKHDYTMANALLKIERLILLLGGGGSSDDTFLQDLANAYTFQATLNISLTGSTGFGGGPINLTAQGKLMLTGDPHNVFPITGSNNVNYTAGVLQNSEGQKFTLQLPLSYPQMADLTIDTCTNLDANIYLDLVGLPNEIGSPVEIWHNPPGTDPPTYTDSDLFDGFMSAFQGMYEDTSGVFSTDWVFPLQFQNLQAQPVNATFTGPATSFSGSVTATLNIVLQHQPQ